MSNDDAASARCPRCGGGFHCGVADAAPCACTSIRLSEQTLADLRARYAGCLCMRCLAELDAEQEKAGAVLRPAGFDGVIESDEDQSLR